MTSIKEVIRCLEEIAPLNYQESYDNAGLIVGNASQAVSGVLVCLDSTEDVVKEAVEKGCNLVVAHHPIIFRGLKKLSGQSYVERTVIRAIKENVALYAIHTNLDNVFYEGVNEKIAQILGLINNHILHPKADLNHRDAPVGAGVVGQLTVPLSEMEFLKLLKSTMRCGCVKHTQLLNKPVKKVAVCGGSGSFLLNQAIKQNADVFVSSDFKYHEFFDADQKIVIADIGHFESEQFTIDLIAGILSEKFSTFAVRSTEIYTNPINYY